MVLCACAEVAKGALRVLARAGSGLPTHQVAHQFSLHTAIALVNCFVTPHQSILLSCYQDEITQAQLLGMAYKKVHVPSHTVPTLYVNLLT